MDIIQMPKIWLAIGSFEDVLYGHPIYYSDDGKGNETGYTQLGWVDEGGYEVMCDAAQAYNDMRTALAATDESAQLKTRLAEAVRDLDQYIADPTLAFSLKNVRALLDAAEKAL